MISQAKIPNKVVQWLHSQRRGGEMERLFDHLDDVLFFAKDLDSIMMHGSQSFIQHCGIRNLAELVGKTDYDLFPPFMADKFREDDRTVIRTAEPMLRLAELFPNSSGLPVLHVTNKFPIFNKAGRVCGVCGTVRLYGNPGRVNQPRREVEKAVQYIQDHFFEPLLVPDLAAIAGMSLRQFERRFKEIFHSTPRAHILRVRILEAAKLLTNTRLSITDIALRTGFYDHCSFTRHFRRHMNRTPLEYRRTH